MGKLIIHIGTAKTGTTAIQSYMHTNRHALLEQGINYPQSAIFGTGHHPLAWSLQNKHGNSLDCWGECLHEIETKDVRINVISSEEFSWFAEPEVEHARQLLAQMPVQIVVYLRNPLDFAVSSYKQWIKTGHFSGTFQEFVLRVSFLLDYGALVERWALGFRRESVEVRLYDKVKESPGLIADFLRHVDGSICDLPVKTGSRVTVSSADGDTRLMLLLNQISDRLDGRARAQRILGRIRYKVRKKTKIGRGLSAVTDTFLSGELVSESDVQFLRDLLKADGRLTDLQSYIPAEDVRYLSF